MNEPLEPPASAPPPRQPSRWRRGLRLALLGLALLYPLYLGLANLFLGTALGPWALSLRPQRLTATWDRAWTLFPGDVRVRGLHLRGEASRARWSLDVDAGRGWIDLPGLLARRFRVVDFAGSGVRSITERKPPPPPSSPPGGRGQGTLRRGWRLAFENVRLRQVREIALDRLRLLGDSEIHGSFVSQVGGALELRRSRLLSRNARLLSGEEPLLREVEVLASATIAPYAPRKHRGTDGFDFVSGSLSVRGLTEGARTAGRLTVGLLLDDGRLRAGTGVLWNLAPRRDLFSLQVVPGAPGGDLQLAADLPELAIGGSGGRPPLFACRELHARSATPETRLSRLLVEARELRQGQNPEGGAWIASVEAAAIEMTSLGLRRSWSLHLDRATGQISLSSLARREIAVSGLRGAGASGWVEVADRPGPTLPPSARPWALRLTRAEIAGIRDFAVNDLTLVGESALRGGFVRDGEGGVRVEGAEAEVARGVLALQGETLARDLHLSATLSLPRFLPPEHPGISVLEIATATLAGSGEAFGPSLRRTAGGVPGSGTPSAPPGPVRSAFRRAEEPKALQLDLRLDRGTLLEGSQLALTLPRLPHFGDAGAPDFLRVAQPLFLAGTVDGGRLNLSAESRGLTLGERPGLPPVLRAARATLSTSTPELHLAKLLPRGERMAAAGAKGAPPLPAGLIGDLSAESLEINGVSQLGRWSARADRAGARIDLSALASRRVDLPQVTAIGVDLRIDRLPRGTPKPMTAPNPWSIAARGARLTQIRSLTLGSDRLFGTAEASGALRFDPVQRLALSSLVLALPAGRIESGREIVARDLALRAEVTLAPAGPETERGLGLLRRFSGTVRGRGKVMSLGFLRRYLKASWLDVRGQGEIDADLRLAEGRLLVGSKVALARGRLQADFLENRAEGSARLLATVETLQGRPAMRIKAAFDSFTLASGSAASETPYIRGQGLALEVTSTDVDLASPVRDLRGTIDLPRAEVPDLRVYNAYLPEGAGVAIEAGTGTLGLHLDLDGVANSARGRVSLTSRDLLCRFQELEIGGRLQLEARLASHDLKGKDFELDGTRLDLDKVAYAELGEETQATNGKEGRKGQTPDWWGHLLLNDGTMTWGRPLTLRSRAQLEMKDSGLLLNLVAQRKSFLHWFEGVLHVENVVARGELAVADGAIVIEPLRVEGGKLDLRSRFRFSKENKKADLYVRWGKLATGIALRDGKRDWKILSPQAWFERREGWAPK